MRPIFDAASVASGDAVSASMVAQRGLNGHAPVDAQVVAPPADGSASPEVLGEATKPTNEQPPFDAIVEENLRRGMYLSQRDALIAVARDPRCTRRHIRVHAEIVCRMNSRTGVCFPGWSTIADDAAMLPGGIPDPDGAYDASTINNITSDLRRWGYFASTKRGREAGGRAIAHYTVARPSIDQLQREITEYIKRARARDRLDGMLDRRQKQGQDDLTDARDVKMGADLTSIREVRIAELTCDRAADLTRVRVTVTCKENEPVEEALAAYNATAQVHGFSVLSLRNRRPAQALAEASP